ncbi:deoxycytidine deaminase (plasmid) [Embleya sp. NBC_00888]|uniref:dCTP deaminase n=1 Tax=Embleya sp. NBC_00888 TaxID=2975960 RepID=UPI002F9172EA|nr:deoxycytidine deaminase [Embleya sp. NBC_00888]
MILTGPEIADRIENASITFEPFDPTRLNPNSVNYHLAPELRVHTASRVDALDPPPTRDVRIPDTGLVLQPRRVHLGTTVETIGSTTTVPSLIGRSSIGRLRLFVRISADLGNLGAAHRWTLEIVAVQPVRVYPYMRIGQVSFWTIDGDPARPHDGYFGRLDDTRPPRPAHFASAVQPVRVYAGMVLAHVTFRRSQGKVTLYHGKYQGSQGPQPSRSWQDFEHTPALSGAAR